MRLSHRLVVRFAGFVAVLMFVISGCGRSDLAGLSTDDGIIDDDDTDAAIYDSSPNDDSSPLPGPDASEDVPDIDIDDASGDNIARDVEPNVDADAGPVEDAAPDVAQDVAVDAPRDGPDEVDAISDASTEASDGNTMLVSVSISPRLSAILVGTSQPLVATATYSNNTTQNVSSMATWSSSAPGVATVVGGLVTAQSPGNAVITVTLSGLSDSIQVSVPAAAVTGLRVTSAVASAGISGTVQFRATANLSNGGIQDVTASSTWSSLNPAVATVNAAGLARSVSAGTARIRASFGGFTDEAVLTVTQATLISIDLTPTNPVVAAAVTFPFTAMASYTDGSVSNVTTGAVWVSSNPSVLTVTSTGMATARAPGSAIVSVTVNSITGSTTVTVNSATLTSITLSPPSDTIVVGTSQGFRASGRYSDNSVIDLTASANWTSNAPAIASVSNAEGSQGIVTALSAGNATITAAVGNLSGTATVSVSPASVASISLSPANGSVPLAARVQVTAVATMSDGSLQDVTVNATWTSDDPSIASVDNTPAGKGMTTGHRFGSTRIQASFGGVSGATNLTVTSASLVSITLSPTNVNLAVGIKQFMRATGTYSDGTSLDITNGAIWSTVQPSIATVSNAPGAPGLLTAMSPGSTEVVAVMGNLSGRTGVQVTAPTLEQIVISPIGLSRAVGERVAYTAMAIYSNLVSQNVTLQATWQSSNPAIATIGTGAPAQRSTATTVSPGQTTISATYGGLTGTTSLTVTTAVVTSIIVSPQSAAYPAGTVQQYRAQAIYSDNTSQDVTYQATWRSANATVAAVSNGTPAKGRVTTIAAGTTQINATWKGITGSTPLTVTAAVVTGISVSPASVAVAVGTNRQFSAQAIYSDNTSRDITNQATWISANPAVVGISDARATRGLATALSVGSSTIRASFAGFTGTATMTVSTASVASIQISPFHATVGRFVEIRFAATALFNDNSTQNVTSTATWQSSSPTVASVSNAAGSKGEAQGLSPGTTNITATWGGMTGSTVLTVTSATLNTIQVTPFAPTVPIGFLTQLQATGIYSDNTTQDLTSQVTWISSVPAAASVSDAHATKGILTPLTPGQTTVGASFQGIVGTTNVTVSSATLQSISIAPTSASIGLYQSQAFVALGRFSDASTMDVSTYVTWLSSTPAIASISNALGSQGIAKGLSLGAVDITAIRGTVSSRASLTVRE